MNPKNYLLQITNLNFTLDNKKILNNLNLSIKPGEVHSIMGPNGSGKSSLALILAGHPEFKNFQGSIKFKNKNLKTLSPTERATQGIFLSFQQPLIIPGISVNNVLRSSFNALQKSQKRTILGVSQFIKLARNALKDLNLPFTILARSFN